MTTGLKLGEKGSDVEQLHRSLMSAGFQIEPGEMERQEFGPSTLQALHSFQREHGLSGSEELDAATLAALVDVQPSSALVVQHAQLVPTSPNGTGLVQGKFRDADGSPIAGANVRLLAMNVRSEKNVGEAATNSQGLYSIAYQRSSPLNLMARAYDRDGKMIAQSAIVFGATGELEIDLTTAASGTPGTPSTFTKVWTAVTAQLHDNPLSDLQENRDTHELRFVAGATGLKFEEVAHLYIAHVLSSMHQIREATLFGILTQGVPSSLGASLRDMPDTGIDGGFAAQVLGEILANSRDSLSHVLAGSVQSNVIPPSYAAAQEAELDRLDAVRSQMLGSAPYLESQTSLNEFLSECGVGDPVKKAFTEAYAGNNRHQAKSLEALRVNTNVTTEELGALENTLNLADLLNGNIPLIKETLSQLAQKKLSTVQDLALLDENDWAARMAALDPEAKSIAHELPDDTPQKKITRFSGKLAARLEAKYPTTAFARKLSKADATSFSGTKDELVAFLTAHPLFDLKRSNVDHFIATNSATLSEAALRDVKKAQRLHRISQDYDAVEALNSAGYQSSQSVYFKGREPFLAEMTAKLGSDTASSVFARAQMTYATALTTYARYNQAFNKVNLAVLPAAAPEPSLLTSLPDLQSLFGSLDYFQCDDCESVLSPAAYLVDLLQYLAGISATGGGVTNARDALLLRRPDLQYTALDCSNTNTTLPYIDMVNEILENAIAAPTPAPVVIDTVGTSAERRALPQQISQAAYDFTAGAVFPLSLPFDRAFAQTTAYINALGTTRSAILSLFAGNPASPTMAAAIAGALLGINPELQNVINGTDAHQPWDRWGLAQNLPQVIDPETGVPYAPNPTDWVAALSKVPVLLSRSGLTIQQLYQLLEVTWVTQSVVTLQAGTTSTGTLHQLSPDLDQMVFYTFKAGSNYLGLTAAALDRANRFLRLWTATGLEMWELDWALEAAAGGLLNDTFLIFLAGAIKVQTQLKLPFQEALSLWMPLETRDVTSHLGDEDSVVLSTYSNTFRNAAVLLSWSSVFVSFSPNGVTAASNTSPIAITTALPHGYQTGMKVSITGMIGNEAADGVFTITVTGAYTFTLNGSASNNTYVSGGVVTGVLSGNVILGPSTAAPTAEQNAITAALGLSGDDISAILTFTKAANSLSLATLNTLLQYQRLASSLSLSIRDLIEWIQLTESTPCGSGIAPADTLEFLRRLAVLQGTGIAVHDLDYLLRHQSASTSSLTFTAAQATALLQTVRDAIAKLPAVITIPITGGSDTSPILINTASANGLQTGAQVSISGVLGNTAANGSFTIIVTSPTSFILNGSTGNGNWAGGGVISIPAYDATTIQTIFVAALVAATGATANVVTPALLKTGVLPLSSSTISLLVSESTGVDPSKSPALINAFTSVAKAAALFTALKPAETEWAFVVQNAATFNWLDPSALPIAPVATSHYARFEALLRAFKLNRRQPARTPRLFDILSQWLLPNSLPGTVPIAIAGPAITITGASNTAPIAVTTAAPHGLATGAQVTIHDVAGNTAANGTFTITVTSSTTFTLDGSSGNGAWISGGSVSVPNLALALNASANDALAIATALTATAPNLTTAGQPGSLADIAMLAAIGSALDVIARYGLNGATLVQLAAVPATSTTASVAVGVLQAQYPQNAWFGAIQPVEDVLRQSRRDALVAYLLGHGPAVAAPPMLTTDDIFDYYLIDPEMSPCASTTRLLQASLTIQQFVQQCFLNLFFSSVNIEMSSSRWSEWSWRQQYRLWQANREVFLYPENYVLPETRGNASSIFVDFENALRQGNADSDAAQSAMEGYIRSLVGIARLRVAALYNETRIDGSKVLHVFAYSQGTPPQWYYRTRTTITPGAGSWSAWEPLNLDIDAQHLVPVIWDQRLCLIWPEFNQISEKQSPQAVPAAGGTGVAQQPPQMFWTIQFATSELSAGQWQAKRMLDEKVFVNGAPYPPSWFNFRASQQMFNLQLQVYLGGGEEIVAQVSQPLPESPLSIVQLNFAVPAIQYIDYIREPTFLLITTAPASSLAGSLVTPAQYSYSGQDLVFGNQNWGGTPGQGPLNVLCTTTATTPPMSITLLGAITNPRIVVPQQEPAFNSDDPFFVSDPFRTYLVERRSFTYTTTAAGVPQLTATYAFQSFYHPYARTFLRELELGGVARLMSRNLQLNTQTVRGWTPAFNFNALYTPSTQYVAQPYPGVVGATDTGESALDFSAGSYGAYSLYNWETFYHIPMFMASLLMQNQQYQDALTWLEYIFNPTDLSGGPSPQRFWQMAPFNAMSQANFASEQVQNILSTLAADTQLGISDPATTTAITNWMRDPYDPHAIASLRISAYAKATVMKFLNLLIAWGDSYYNQYTAEMVSQAEQLYILADMILGPRPQMLRPSKANQGAAGSATYASLNNIDAFSNVLVSIENLIVAPEPPQSVVNGTATPPLPVLSGSGNTLLFCVPPNAQLLGYWDTVADRLYKVRNCLNLQGVSQPLPLYAPAINPLQLAQGAASGGLIPDSRAAAPIYRFTVCLEKAIDMTNDVRSYGALILSALEKQDIEALSVLRANQELDIQTRMLDLKSQAITEAQDQITALQNQKAVVQIRYNFYANIAFMNASESAALDLQQQAVVKNGVAIVRDQDAAPYHLYPSASVGMAGFGGTPSISASYGGENKAGNASAWASVYRGKGGILSEQGNIAATMGSYYRRQDDWGLQASLAQAELTQLASQITAATDRLNIAQKELSIQQAQIANAQAVSDFLTTKYTSAQLYNWMISQLTTVYTQAYQLAFSLALQAQNAYRYELGSVDTFLQFGYWDSQHKGLTAGESLLFDLRRMDAQYLASNSREQELTKHVSLALTSPLALVMLRETGTCQIALDEVLFESDHPGQYFRRLRSVALTVPCVTGPYTGVNATLSLTNSLIRTHAPGSGYKPQMAAAGPNDPNNVIASPGAANGTLTISTSSGQSDSGLFSANMGDERWLPFEGQGAISTWNLVLDPRDNNFDFTTITDVILHVRFTARGGGDTTAANVVRTAIQSQMTRSVFVSVRNTFGGAYYQFFNPAVSTAPQQTLTLPLTNVIFPYSNFGTGGVKIQNLTFYVALSVPSAGNTISATFTVGSGAPAALSLAPTPVQTTAGTAASALTAATSPATAAPQTFTITVPATGVPAGLAATINGQIRLDQTKIEDILLVIDYSLT